MCGFKLLPSVLWRCWLGGRKASGLQKTEQWGSGMVICLERGAELHMAQRIPLPLTVSWFSKIQIGFTFLVLAHLGSPGQRAVKRVCVWGGLNYDNSKTCNMTKWLTAVKLIGAIRTVIFTVTTMSLFNARSIITSELISCALSRRRPCWSRCPHKDNKIKILQAYY